MEEFKRYRAWAEISQAAILHNLALVRERTGAKVMCVIKGNAHGHGAAACGRILEEAGADAFAVACLPEAIELREAGIRRPILILGWTHPDSAEELLRYDLTQSILDEAYARELDAALTEDGRKLPVHVKLDTGMTRTGVDAQHDPRAAAETVLHIDALPHLDVRGLFTHFAASDMPEKDAYTAWQLDNYKAVLAALKELGFEKDVLHHTGNSAAILHHPDSWFDMVRAGIMLYGLYPTDLDTADYHLERALALKARVAQVREIPAGTSVSYGCTFTSEKPMRVAVVTAGYADSYPRLLSNRGAWAVIRGQKCPQIGRVCMDMTMFDVSGTEAEEGDEAILYGRGGMPLEEVARLTGSNNIEQTCLLTQRVTKIYV